MTDTKELHVHKLYVADNHGEPMIGLDARDENDKPVYTNPDDPDSPAAHVQTISPKMFNQIQKANGRPPMSNQQLLDKAHDAADKSNIPVFDATNDKDKFKGELDDERQHRPLKQIDIENATDDDDKPFERTDAQNARLAESKHQAKLNQDRMAVAQEAKNTTTISIPQPLHKRAPEMDGPDL